LSLRLPYFSVDSTYWLQGVRFGKSTLYDPRDPAVRHRIRYNGHDVYRPEVASLLSTFYSTDPAVVRPARQREFVDFGGPVLLCPALDMVDLTPIARRSAARAYAALIPGVQHNSLSWRARQAGPASPASTPHRATRHFVVRGTETFEGDYRCFHRSTPTPDGFSKP